jgi:hypothetical protein
MVTMMNAGFWNVMPYASYSLHCSYLTDSFHLDDGGGYISPKCQFLQEPHSVRSQKKAFFLCNLCLLICQNVVQVNLGIL